MGRKSINRGVSALGTNRSQFDCEFEGVRYRPTLERAPTEANLRRARVQPQGIKERIAHGTFSFAEEFPEYRFGQRVGNVTAARTCDDVFDEYLASVEPRVANHDLAFATTDGCRKILDNVWRSKIGTRLFSEVRYSELMKIAAIHRDRGEVQGNSDEFRFFTGLQRGPDQDFDGLSRRTVAARAASAQTSSCSACAPATRRQDPARRTPVYGNRRADPPSAVSAGALEKQGRRTTLDTVP